jgi:hypothetical protein
MRASCDIWTFVFGMPSGHGCPYPTTYRWDTFTRRLTPVDSVFRNCRASFPTTAGGLGIPQLSRFIPLLRLKRFERLAHSSVESVRECARTDTAVAKVRWCRERLADVVDQVADGTRGWSVKRKVSYRTVVGVRRPDIVASQGREIAVMDVQVVAPNPSLDSAHRKKVAKYRDEAQLATCLVRGASVQPRRRAEEETQVRFASATISWRGVWSSESAQSLRELGLTDGSWHNTSSTHCAALG